MKRAAGFLLFWVPLWWLWQLFSGEWSRYEWIAGAAGATVAATIAELARARAGVAAPYPWRVVKGTPAALGMVFRDFATVMLVLVRRGEGTFRRTPFAQPNDVAHRAWATLVGDYSPNAYIVDIDEADGTAVTHHLVPRQASQEPV